MRLYDTIANSYTYYNEHSKLEIEYKCRVIGHPKFQPFMMNGLGGIAQALLNSNYVINYRCLNNRS